MHTCMEKSLPSEITTEILSRLPTDSVLQCRLVCKTWRHLFCHPSFAHKHLRELLQLDGNSISSHSSLIASKVGSGFLFFFKFTGEQGCQLYYGEYDNQPDKKLRRINEPPKIHQSIVGSCNGLICFSKGGYGPLNEFNYDYEPTYVCNPITGEYVSVNYPGLREKLRWEDKLLQSMVCGFGYHHSTNEYKIVRIYYIPSKPLGQVQVYTLGSDSGWRDLGETAYSLRYMQNHSDDLAPFGTFANGALHWLDLEKKIVSFDLADEKFYLLPPPPFVRVANVQNYYKLRVLGGCLCFIHQKKDEQDIWFLRNKAEDSIEDVNEQDYDSLSWIKKFSIPIGSDAVPIALTNSGQVLFQGSVDLFCYDPETTAVSDNLIRNDRYRVLRVVPHMNSLVSLEGLGKYCLQRTRYDVNPAPKEIFIKQQRKHNGEIGVSSSLTMTRCLGKQVVSPVQAIGSNLEKSTIMLVGAEASHSSKAAHIIVNDSSKRKSHCSDRPAKQDHLPQELFSSDENIPLRHRSRHFIWEGGSGVGGTQKIVAHAKIFSDDGDVEGTCGEVGATSPLRPVTKRHKGGSDISDQGSGTAGPEPDRPCGQGVGKPIEKTRGSSLMSPIDRSERGKVNRPLPEYTAPQLCPPNFLMVAGFPVLPEYKDLYTRVIASKGHMASDAKVKSMYIQATMVTELLETIQQMSKLSGRDVTSIDLQRWRAAVDTASSMDFHVSWLDDQLHLLESQICDIEKQKAKRRSLEVEVRCCEKRIPLLRSKKNEAMRAYEAAKVDKAELIAKVATLKASLASHIANNQASMALTRSALGSCLATPH